MCLGSPSTIYHHVSTPFCGHTLAHTLNTHSTHTLLDIQRNNKVQVPPQSRLHMRRTRQNPTSQEKRETEHLTPTDDWHFKTPLPAPALCQKNCCSASKTPPSYARFFLVSSIRYLLVCGLQSVLHCSVPRAACPPIEFHTSIFNGILGFFN